MNIIVCMFIDSDGKIKYAPDKFNSNKCDLCVSNYKMGAINSRKTLYYNIDLDYDEQYGEDTCWTVAETIRRINEINPSNVKIFTLLDNFYEYATEIQFAFSLDCFKDNEYNERIDVEKFKEVCKNFKKTYIGKKNNIKFYKYEKNEEEK